MPQLYGYGPIPGLDPGQEKVRVKDTFETGFNERFRPPIAEQRLPNPARAPRESLVGARSRQYLNRTARPSSMRPGRNLGINMQGFGRTLRPSSMRRGRNLGINMEGFGSTRIWPSRPRRPRRQLADVSFWRYGNGCTR